MPRSKDWRKYSWNPATLTRSILEAGGVLRVENLMLILVMHRMIHVASLLHDDVIDGADVRRGLRALNAVFGNKVAILAGDFLLARASVSLASLRNTEVIQLLSQVIEDLVTGEILQVQTRSPRLAFSINRMQHTTYTLVG